jgi:hypothetical protein
MYIHSIAQEKPLCKGRSAGKTGKGEDRSMGYPAKVQLITRPSNLQWYVNFPNAVAQAIGLRKGETVEWEIESRSILVMVRTEATPARKLKKKGLASGRQRR